MGILERFRRRLALGIQEHQECGILLSEFSLLVQLICDAHGGFDISWRVAEQ